MNKLMYVWFAVKTLFCTCQSDHKLNNIKKVRSEYKISKIGKLPSSISESSGLARTGNERVFWTHNDSGGKPELLSFDLDGKRTSSKIIPQSKNIDWEDLAEDRNGNIYIGDFGNNASSRTEYQVYQYDTTRAETKQIRFRYAGQQNTSGQNAARIFDCEAFFHYQGDLYLFSKNWEKGGNTRLYKLPARPGEHVISAIDSIRIDNQVTSADISPDGKRFALLTYGKVLLFEVSAGGINFKKPLGCFRMVRKQNEAILFLNNTDMLVTNEQGGIFRITYRGY